MNKPIVKDVLFLGQKSDEASPQDVSAGQDLQDTLKANQDRCAGMAANMIGVPKNIIAILPPGTHFPIVMLNPQIIAKSGEYEIQEGCLSLPGERPVKRFRKITVKWLDLTMRPQKRTFEGYPAQIIQHEIDHCSGILI